VIIPRSIAEEIRKHSLEAAPAEACGVLSGPTLVCHPVKNLSTVEGYFEMDPDEELEVFISAAEQGRTIWAVWHSHPTQPAIPSPADIEMALDRDIIYLICSPTREGSGQLRAWRIVAGATAEIPVEINEEE